MILSRIILDVIAGEFTETKIESRKKKEYYVFWMPEFSQEAAIRKQQLGLIRQVSENSYPVFSCYCEYSKLEETKKEMIKKAGEIYIKHSMENIKIKNGLKKLEQWKNPKSNTE